jgi:hypothetical protein
MRAAAVALAALLGVLYLPPALPVRLYGHLLSPANHPLRRTKATQPPELKLFGSGTACAHLDSGCTVRKHIPF